MNYQENKKEGLLKRVFRPLLKTELLFAEKGLSSFELAIVVAVICICFIAGGVFLHVTSKSAYDITARHDLKEFAEYQVFHFKLNDRCVGELGQSIRNDGVASDLEIEDYTVSEGVCITVVSGSPDDPYDIDNPYKFQAKHERSDTVFEYNFQNGETTER